MGLLYSNAVAQRTKTFVTAHKDEIISAISGTGIFFSTIVAQKCLESSYGTSVLATRYNNFGGIKNFGGTPYAIDTTNTGYAIFPNAAASFKSYVATLQSTSKKYISMGVFTAANPEEQIRRIAQAGYTETPPDKYVSSMRSIIYACTDIYKLGKIG